MPRISSIPEATHTKILLAWHGEEAVSEIALRLEVTPSVIYSMWYRAKKLRQLPNHPRSEGHHIYPKRECLIEHDIVIPDPDPLLARLARHHRPGHGELSLRSP